MPKLSEQQKQVVHSRVLAGQAIPVKLSGQGLLLDGLGVLFWPKHNLLIFSDLHFEKASFLSQFANPIPRLDTKDTLKNMEYCLSTYAAQHVVCLGDSLHDGNAIKRMADEDILLINDMVKGVNKWSWILGNHDPDIPLEISGERAAFLHIENLLLVHEPEDLAVFKGCDAQIIGHFHPKARRRIAKHFVKGKCFLKNANKLLMPAFGAYTGGLDSDDEALTSMMSADHECYLMFNKHLYLV